MVEELHFGRAATRLYMTQPAISRHVTLVRGAVQGGLRLRLGGRAQYLVECGVALVGVDDLSVGGFLADGEATHRALLEAGVAIVEGLDLGGVAPGRYELVCLPLPLAGSDGAPARALLRPLGPETAS